jgi:hypothetical protein
MPDPKTSAPKFPSGQSVITANAAISLHEIDVAIALGRHQSGDWGDLDNHDQRANERALREGGRLFSVYSTPTGQRFYVITECDNTVTTALLPEDY